MLEPNSRQLLRELLRPPAGFHFDRAISTTYTLNLMSLLTMPVAFTMFDRTTTDGTAAPDPLALLQAIRQHADRIHVFCQASRIAVPKRHHLLFAHLEDSVIEVTPPSEHGIFHPKLTVLRFVGDLSALPEDHPDREQYEPVVRYRLLCSTRNLTFDRSWDTMLVLEGDLASHRRRPFARNHPLGRFVEALPDLAIRPVDQDVRKACRRMADELRRVDFELPDRFDDLTFWPIGLGNEKMNWPFPDDMDRLLVISPFVSDDLLGWFEPRKSAAILVSRDETLDELADETIAQVEAYVLNPSADEPTRQTQADEESERLGAESADPSHTDNKDAPVSRSSDDSADAIDDETDDLSGLHAKAFVADRGRHTHLWTGSANATDAAFSGNIEFLIELRGPRRRYGVQTLVRPADQREAPGAEAMHFDNLLDPYHRADEPTETDEERQEAERLVDQCRRTLAGTQLAIHVESPVDPNAEPLHHDGEAQYRLRLVSESKEPVALDERLSIRCRPATLPDHRSADLHDVMNDRGVAFDAVSFKAITAFAAFDVEAKVGRAGYRSSFVLNLPLRGAPADRHEQLLTALLANREQLLRYLLMLLAENEHDLRAMAESIDAATEQPGPNVAHMDYGLPLLEPLLKTLEHQPARLDQVARLVEDLARHEHGRDLLPEGFMDMWQPIWQARKEAAR